MENRRAARQPCGPADRKEEERYVSRTGREEVQDSHYRGNLNAGAAGFETLLRAPGIFGTPPMAGLAAGALAVAALGVAVGLFAPLCESYPCPVSDATTRVMLAERGRPRAAMPRRDSLFRPSRAQRCAPWVRATSLGSQ